MADETQHSSDPGDAVTDDPDTDDLSPESPDEVLAEKQATEPHGYLRLCRHCSTEVVTDAPTCPVCGTPYIKEPWLTRRRLVAIAAVAAVVLGGFAGLMLWRNHQEQQRVEAEIAAQQAAEARRQAEAEAAEAARRAAAEAAAEKARQQVLMRKLTVSEIESSVTKMARQHSQEGLIEGWPKRTDCTPVGSQSLENLNATTTRFSCFVTTERHNDGTASGHYYHAIMNWGTGRYTYGYGE